MTASARPARQPKPNGGTPVTPAEIERVRKQVASAIVETPCIRSRTLSDLAGCEVWLKFENLQFTASFKERGALAKLLSLTPEERARGVVAMSAGNHALGVAYHAERLGIPATIVMPLGTPFTKIRHTEDHGARVIVEGEMLADAQRFAESLAAKEKLVFVHPYDDDRVIAGQGTIALEMLETAPALDTLVLPIGGGGLISGCAIAAKARKPNLQVFGVQTELYPCMYRAIRGETGASGGATVAEGIAVQNVAERTKAIIAKLVAEILLVSEREIEHAVALLMEVEKTVVEGAGAVGLAALLKHRDRFAGRTVGLVLTAGNIDPRVLASIILRELSRTGRVSTFHIELNDRPGALARITSVIGDAGGNIIEVLHNRLSSAVSVKGVAVDITIETRDAEHRDLIARSIAEAGFRYRIVEA